MGLAARIRTLFRVFVLFTVLVTVALLSAITTIRLTIHSGQEKTPNLVGQPLQQAERLAGGMGLGVKVEDRLFSDQYAEGRVVSQVPAPGASTKAGQDIHVLVSLGTPRVTVPNLVGDSVRAAQVTSVQRGLTLGDVATVHWTGTATDQVVGQEPPPSTLAVHSPSVDLLVSLGEPAPEFVCPSFIGKPIDVVRSKLTSAGFAVGSVATPAPPPSAPVPAGSPVPTPSAPGPLAAPSGTILSQSPPPGSKIAAGTSFSFTVAP
jgi:eukaryotic-like serine/threonine-protein kinase